MKTRGLQYWGKGTRKMDTPSTEKRPWISSSPTLTWGPVCGHTGLLELTCLWCCMLYSGHKRWCAIQQSWAIAASSEWLQPCTRGPRKHPGAGKSAQDAGNGRNGQDTGRIGQRPGQEDWAGSSIGWFPLPLPISVHLLRSTQICISKISGVGLNRPIEQQRLTLGKRITILLPRGDLELPTPPASGWIAYTSGTSACCFPSANNFLLAFCFNYRLFSMSTVTCSWAMI